MFEQLCKVNKKACPCAVKDKKAGKRSRYSKRMDACLLHARTHNFEKLCGTGSNDNMYTLAKFGGNKKQASMYICENYSPFHTIPPCHYCLYRITFQNYVFGHAKDTCPYAYCIEVFFQLFYLSPCKGMLSC